MPASQFQTTESTATIPRMRPAARFGARLHLVLLLLFAAAPLWAEAPLRTIEVSMMFSICRDRIRVACSRGANLSAKSTLADFGLKAEDLNGTVTDASNYGMFVESLDTPLVVLVYRKRLEFQDLDRNATLNLDKWTLVEYAPREVPTTAGASIWPDAAHEHVEERLRHEERIRREWLGLLEVSPWCLAALLIALFWWRTRIARWDVVLGALLISCAIVALLQYTGALAYPYGFASNALVYGILGAIVIASIGGAVVNPYSSERFFLHIVGMAPAMVLASLIAGMLAQSASVGIAVAVPIFCALALLARWRTARSARQSGFAGNGVQVRQ